jgi:hypothetical protein
MSFALSLAANKTSQEMRLLKPLGRVAVAFEREEFCCLKREDLVMEARGRGEKAA